MVYQFFAGPGTVEEVAQVDAVALDFFQGYTRIATQGGWRAPDGTTYQEGGNVWLVDTPMSTAPRVFAEQIRRILHQQAVLIVAYPGATSLLVTEEKTK